MNHRDLSVNISSTITRVTAYKYASICWSLIWQNCTTVDIIMTLYRGRVTFCLHSLQSFIFINFFSLSQGFQLWCTLRQFIINIRHLYSRTLVGKNIYYYYYYIVIIILHWIDIIYVWKGCMINKQLETKVYYRFFLNWIFGNVGN